LTLTLTFTLTSTADCVSLLPTAYTVLGWKFQRRTDQKIL